MGYKYYSVIDNTGLSSFVYPLLAPKSAREFELIAGQGQPRSNATFC